MSEPRFDIAVYDREGQVVLGVAANAHWTTPGTHRAAAWVEQVRRSVFADVPTDRRPAFLVATPSGFYFWKAGLSDEDQAAVGGLATFEWSTEADEILKPYFERAGVRPGAPIDAGVFETIVWWWLGDVVSGIAEHQSNLERQGFYQTLAGGRVQLKSAA